MVKNESFTSLSNLTGDRPLNPMSMVYTVLLHLQIHCYFLHKSGHARVLEKPTLILYILDSYNRKEKSHENLKSGVLMQCQHKLFS